MGCIAMNMSFGEALRRLRVERDLSQQQLADLLHVDRTTISKWESGTRLPDADMIALLSDSLGTDVSRLLRASAKSEQKLTVILVDDERIILDDGISVLKEVFPNARVLGFTNPADAVAFAGENKVQLAFLDIEMGRISGLDVCRELLESEPWMNVIFLTAFSRYSLDAWDTGACGFMEKPLTAGGVLRQLSRLRWPIGEKL